MKEITKTVLQISCGTIIGTIIYSSISGHWVGPAVSNIEILIGIWLTYWAMPKGEQ